MKFPSFRFKPKMVVPPPTSSTKLKIRYERQNIINGNPETVELMFNDKAELDQWLGMVKQGNPDFHYELREVQGKMGTAMQRTGFLSGRAVPAFIPESEKVVGTF